MQVWEATQECPKPRDQALSLWSGSTDSKTLDYQRTNPREYQIVRTHTKKSTWIQDPASPNQTTSSILCRTPHPSDKQNKNTNPIINRQDYHLTQLCSPEEKQKKKLSINLTLYEAYTNRCTNLRGQKPKGRKNSTLKPGKRRPQTQ